MADLGEKQELRSRTAHPLGKEAYTRGLILKPRIEKNFPRAASCRISLLRIPTKPAGGSNLSRPLFGREAGHHSDLKAARSDGVPVGCGG